MGNPNDQELRELVGRFQESYNRALDLVRSPEPRLVVDKDWGPNTRSALMGKPRPEMRPEQNLSVMERAFELALADLGKGGDPGKNNSSAWIMNMREELGLRVVVGPWCAVAASSWLVRAGVPAHVASTGAWRLTENVRRLPEGYVVDADETLFGQVYVASWKREPQGGHVRLVKDIGGGKYHQVGGNEGGRKDFVQETTVSRAKLKKGLIQLVAYEPILMP